MQKRSLQAAVEGSVGLIIATFVLHTWLMMGWIAPVTVSGSSMAPALLGPHRIYHCPDCRHGFAVGLDQIPLRDEANCPSCGQHRAVARVGSDRRGARITIDRTAFAWREPRRWEVVVFRCPEKSGELCVKRVVGLPGETVSLRSGDVLIGGQVVRKSLAEQKAVRQLVYAVEAAPMENVRAGDSTVSNLPRWQLVGPSQYEYHHLAGRPITDEVSYNQAAAPPPNRVSDIMLTFRAQFAGRGRLELSASDCVGRCELAIDLGQRRISLRREGRLLAERPLPAPVGQFSEWTFSLFDRQVLLAVDDHVALAEPWEADQVSQVAPENGQPRPPLTIRFEGLSGQIRELAVWRDVYYAIRHGDGRQRGATHGETTTWRLGPGEFFVLGDNAAVSDDSRSWLSRAAVDAKLLIGKPLGVR